MLNFHDAIIAIQVVFSKSSLKSTFLPPKMVSLMVLIANNRLVGGDLFTKRNYCNNQT